MLILAFEQTSEFIENNDYTEIKIKQNLAIEINKLFQNGKIPDELQPKDMSRFCDNLYRLLISVVKEKKIKKIVKQIIQKIQSTKKNQIPRSISLFQYFITILVSEEIIDASINKYYWHITQEVISLYPSLKNVSSTFEYEEKY